MLVVVTGTATDIGKTWFAAHTATALRTRATPVVAYKPAQSFAPGDTQTDADVLAAATGDAADQVCPRTRWYEVPMAPPMAAEVLGRAPFTIGDLTTETL